MKKLIFAAVAGLLFQGCGGGAGVYPGTDVIEPRDFELKVASSLQMSGGQLHSGNMEYSGTGELVHVYREYLAAMRLQGWTGAADDIQPQKAMGTLRKDNRTCSIEFTSAGGTIRANIKISQTK